MLRFSSCAKLSEYSLLILSYCRVIKRRDLNFSWERPEARVDKACYKDTRNTCIFTINVREWCNNLFKKKIKLNYIHGEQYRVIVALRPVAGSCRPSRPERVNRSLEPLLILVKSIRRDVSTESRNARSDVRISRRNENKAAGGGTQRGALLIAKQWVRTVPHLELFT